MQKIVYVEDNVTLVKIMTMVLSAYYDVKSFISSKEAINYIKNDKAEIDIVLSDYKMPEYNGLDVLSTAKNKSTEIVCILLTGYAESDLVNKGDESIDLLLDKNKYSDLNSIKKKIDEVFSLRKNKTHVLL